MQKLLIVPTIVGGKTRYKLGMTGPDEFPSLQELVAFYLREGIPSSQQAGDVIRLRAPNSSDHPDEEEA